MTAASLRSRTAKDLAQMAREDGISGWHSMRKEELIRALLKASRRHSKLSPVSNGPASNGPASNGPASNGPASNGPASNGPASNGPASNGPASKRASVRRGEAGAARGREKTNGSRPRASSSTVAGSSAGSGGASAHARRRIHQLHSKLATIKNLASNKAAEQRKESGPAGRRDRLVVMVRDPYWLHAYWELTQPSVDRAAAAMAQRWHGARPILRLYQLQEDGVSQHERDIEIHGGVSNWYVDVSNPPSTYRLEIGYLALDGQFYPLARSNDVQTPQAGTSDAVDENWTDVAEQADRIFAMSGGYSPRGASRELQELLEERLRRPLGSPMKTRFGNGAAIQQSQLQFAVDAEVIIYGAADRDAHVTLQGEPVQLREDGTFAVRLSMPDRRQVVPIVASSYDGVEQRTIVLAVERNTKVMEPVVRDVTSGT